MKLRVLGPAVAIALSLSGFRPAEAALTNSEQAQIRDYVSSSRVESAGRVRALVARTDLSADEAQAALGAAYASVTFDAPRARLLREVVFGQASAASRPLLAPVAVRAVLARADAVLATRGGALERGDTRTADELFAIYTFVEREIAGGGAGRELGTGHDPQSGIPARAYEDAAAAMREHLERNARWLKGDGKTSEGGGVVRAQAQRTLVDLTPDGVTKMVDVAAELGLRGTRQKALVSAGVLIQDAGALDDVALGRIGQLLEQLPAARRGLALVYVGEDRKPLVARGAVVQTGGMAGPDAERSPFADDVLPVAIDKATSSIATDLATLATVRALDDKMDLRARATADAARVGGDRLKQLGRPRAPSVEHVLGASVALLVLDAPRAVDLAMVRLLQGKPESLALLSDALGVLAAGATRGGEAGEKSFALGRDGSTAIAKATVQKLESGAATAFTIDGDRWSVERDQDGIVRGARHDSEPVSLAHLPNVKTPMTGGERWTEGALAFIRLRGAPSVGIIPSGARGRGPTVKMRGGAPKGYDAIGATPPAADFAVEGEIFVRGGPAGLAIRAENGRHNLLGILLVATPDGRVSLLASDESGQETPLAEATQGSQTFPMRVRLQVKGAKIEATVGAATLRGTAPAVRATGDVGLVATKGAEVEVRELRMAPVR